MRTNFNSRREPARSRPGPSAIHGRSSTQPAAERVAELLQDLPLHRASQPPAAPARACPHHGEAAVVEIPLKAVNGYSRFECARCRLKLGLGASSEAGVRRWAEGYSLRSGRHRRRTLGSLAATADDRAHLRWLSTGTDDAARAARLVLGGRTD
jgi:hypothetical protein